MLDGAGDLAAAVASELAHRESADSELIAAVIEHHRSARCDHDAPRFRALLEVLTRPIDREVASAHLAVALADSGRTNAAAQLADDALRDATSSAGRAVLLWALAETELAGARPTRCQRAAERARSERTAPFPTDPLVELAVMWSALAVLPEGEKLAVQVVRSPWPALGAAVDEASGIEQLANADRAAAALSFGRAAKAWTPVHLRGAFRCRLAEAEAELGRDVSLAVGLFRELETEGTIRGLRPTVARARAGLRRAGIRASPYRGIGRGSLSAREIEVLELIRSGYTTSEIAQLLGTAASTVETQAESGMRKLGARTRAHAVALVEELVQ
jgi:DNA-binding CsgD family transcriptional regulator